MKRRRRVSIGRSAADILNSLVLSLVILSTGCDSADTNELPGRIVYGERVDVSFQVFVMNADGTGRTQLTSTGDNLLPRWSPDGTRIIYGANKAGDWNIYSIAPDGSNEKVFVALGTNDDLQAISTPAWSPDGSTLIHTGRQFMYRVRGDGTGIEKLSEDPCNCSQPHWSPDGRSIAFVYRHGDEAGADFDIYVAGADGRNAKNLTATPTAQEAAPAWSPNGDKIAFVRGNGLGLSNIFVMDSDGSNVRQLTRYTSGDIAGKPTWSADGTKIAYSRLGRGIYVMNPDGSGQWLLGGGSSAVWPDWQ